MRELGENGLPRIPEFIEELDSMVCALDERSYTSSLTRQEQAVVDVYETIGGVEGGGLISFWNAYDEEEADRVLDSFHLIGEGVVAGMISESQVFHLALLEVGSNDVSELGPERSSSYDELEVRVWNSFFGLPTKLLEFAKRNKIKG